MINYSCFVRLLADVQDCNDLDSYISECGGSVPMDDAQQVVRLMQAIWEMAHDGLTIKRIAAACGLSVRQISIRYGISKRTLENWSSCINTPSAWELPMIAYAVLSDCMAVDQANG